MKKPGVRRIRDFALYVAIGLICGLGAIWYASIGDPNAADRFGRWGGLALNTLLLYGYVIKHSKGLLRLWSFWLPLTVILGVHFAVFALILTRAEHWKLLWFLAMYPVEIPIIAAVCWRKEPSNAAHGDQLR